MRSRTLAIAGSIAALTFAATPVAALAASTHQPTTSVRSDRSPDPRGTRDVDRTPDKHGADRSTDKRDR